MLFISYSDPNTADTGWHVGESCVLNGTIPSVSRVQADGDELSFLEHHFSNLPMARSRTVIWRGEMAQFIAENLTLLRGKKNA